MAERAGAWMTMMMGTLATLVGCESARPPVLEPLETRQMLAAQPYDWRSVTIKANGFIDGIVYHPLKADLIYIHTDMGGAYRWDQPLERWTPLNDWSQWNDWPAQNLGVETMAVDPTDPDRVYMAAGTYMSPTAILRSTDQGRTWLRADVSGINSNGNGSARNAGERMQVDPNSPNILYYGTRDDGLWKSVDHGATWARMSSFPTIGEDGGVEADTGIVWVLFDKSSASPGAPTQTIYAGVVHYAGGADRIYRTTNGGTTWEAVPGGQPTTANYFPQRAALAPDGNTLYLTYGFSTEYPGPYGITEGMVWKATNPDAAAPDWIDISPPVNYGFSGVALDPTSPSTVYVTELGNYNPADRIWKSTTGGGGWTAISPNSNRNDSSAPYAASLGVHWMGDLQVNPSNRDDAMFTTGYGLYRTSNFTASTPSWTFFNEGFEQSAVLELASPNSGSVNLFSAIGDRDGYRHDNFAVSPAIGRHGQNNGLARGTSDDIDVAFAAANHAVRILRTSPWVQYSNDNGVTWTWFPSTNTAGSGNGGGNIAISADGTKAVYEPGGSGQVRFSTRTGNSWSPWTNPTSNTPANGARIVADTVVAQTFFAYAGTTVWRSTDGGANWTVMTTSAPSGGGWIRALPGQGGHLVMSRGNNGVWRSTNGGASWSQLGAGVVTTAHQVGVGAGPTADGYPSIYVGGTAGGVTGFFRSDDQGGTWMTISDSAHQFGFVTVIQGDPRVHGRLYVGTNGRGVLYGEIHNAPPALPAGWNTQDIGATSSSGAAGEQDGTWEVIGGGGGSIGGTSDNFHFAYTQLPGDGAITARVVAVPMGSPANNNAKAGVMIRDSLATNARSAFVAVTPGSVHGVEFHARTSVGGSSSTANHTLGVWPPYWVRLVRSGDTFTAYRSEDGVTWTQLGAAQTIKMGATVQVGLAVTSSDSQHLNVATFDNVNLATAPASVVISQVAPDPRQSGVSTLTLAFDRPVPGFSLDDVQLTRAGEAVPLDVATLSSGDGGVTWIVGNLAALTARVGDYAFTVATAGGAALEASATESWVMNLLVGTSGAEEIMLIRSGDVASYFRDGIFRYAFSADAIDELLLDGGGGADLLVLDDITVTLAATHKLASLSLGNGARLNVRDHDLVIDYAPGSSPIGGSNGSAYTGLTGQIATGRIHSTFAQAGATTLGIAEAADALTLGPSETAVWRGVTVDEHSVLIKYTYAGDANLDGFISGDDYSAIDFASATPGASGWANGDFNYDGIISGDDYAIIDFNVVAQGPSLQSSRSAAAAAFSHDAVSSPAASETMRRASIARFRWAEASFDEEDDAGATELLTP